MEKKKQNVFVLALLVLISAWCIVNQVYVAFTHDSIGMSISFIILALSLLFLIYYVLAGYKKPHGNSLRYVIISYCVAIIFTIAMMPEVSSVMLALVAVVLALMAYMAGRLDKIKQNIIILILAFTCQFVVEVISLGTYPIISAVMFPMSFGGTIECLVIGAAYLVRYKEHKEAGLMDAPKAE